MDIKEIIVEVAYAEPQQQKILQVSVPAGATLEMAIDRSGILELFPEIDLMQQKVGVFGQLKKLSDKLQAGDRVEIYRKLTIDPKDARRARARKRR